MRDSQSNQSCLIWLVTFYDIEINFPQFLLKNSSQTENPNTKRPIKIANFPRTIHSREQISVKSDSAPKLIVVFLVNIVFTPIKIAISPIKWQKVIVIVKF